jgi:hypothetical protein
MELLASDSYDISNLKLFWFILGQWDTSASNVLLMENNQLIAIDNANIAHIQKVSAYGDHHFVRLFYTDLDDEGSIENPVELQGNGRDILTKLNETFDDLPQFYINRLENLADRPTSFTYFIEGNRVWRNFNDDRVTPQYFSPEVNLESIQKFKNVDCTIFDQLTNKFINDLDDNILSEIDLTPKEFSAQLNNHFELICQGIISRYELVEDHYHSMNAYECNLDNPYSFYCF